MQERLWSRGKPPSKYTHWLDCIEKDAIARGYNGDFLEVWHFHAVHNWLPFQKLAEPWKDMGNMYGWVIPSPKELQRKAIGFNNPWQTSMIDEDGRQRAEVLKFADGSFFQQILSCLELPDDVLRQHLHADSYKLLSNNAQVREQPKKRDRKEENADSEEVVSIRVDTS